MKILLIWIKNPLPEEYHYTLLTLKRFLREDDHVDIIVDDITKNIEDFKDFNKIHLNEILNKNELNFINVYKFIEHKADYLRFKWLSENKGLYLDIDIIHFKDFHQLIDSKKQLILFEEIINNNIKNFLCGYIYSNQPKIFKLLLNKIIPSKINKRKFTIIIDMFMNEIKNSTDIDKLIYPHYVYVYYNFFKQKEYWKNINLDFIMNELNFIYKQPDVYGLALMKDPIRGKYNREKYVISFIKNIF